MASPHLYVRSTDGNNSDNGTTWSLAKATVAGAAAIDSTTDKRIWVSDNHAESNSSAQTWAFAGTLADPTWVICVDDSTGEPPTTGGAVATTATCTTTGASGVNITGDCYIYGVTWEVGTGFVNAAFSMREYGGQIKLEKCTININGEGSSSVILLGETANSAITDVKFSDVNVSFASSGQGIRPLLAVFEWDGGSVGTSPDLTSGLIQPYSTGEHVVSVVSGCDLTEVGVTGFLVGKTNGCAVDVTFRNCKIPAFTTGGLYTGTLEPGDKIVLQNCDSADTNYRLWVAYYWGSISQSTSIYNDAGATDGTTRISWSMVSSANCEFPNQTLVSPEIVKWNETTTGTLTATVEIVHDSQGSGTNGALRDDEIWLEVMCIDPGGTPIGKWQSDMCANLNLNSNAADQASSSATWTGDSSGWDTQKLSVSFTPKEKGYVHARVHLAKASATVYVDPLLTIA